MLPPTGAALITLADSDKAEVGELASGLVDQGYQVYATEGTAQAMRASGSR